MKYLRFYFVCNTLFCIYIFQALTLGWLGEYSYFCEPIDYSNTPKAILVKRKKSQSIRN